MASIPIDALHLESRPIRSRLNRVILVRVEHLLRGGTTRMFHQWHGFEFEEADAKRYAGSGGTARA